MTSINFYQCPKLILRANWRSVAHASSAILRPEGCAGPSVILPQRTKRACSAAHRSHRSRTMTVLSAQQELSVDQVRLGVVRLCRQSTFPRACMLSSFPLVSSLHKERHEAIRLLAGIHACGQWTCWNSSSEAWDRIRCMFFLLEPLHTLERPIAGPMIRLQLKLHI